jgi:hypothetical protein
MIGRDQEKSTGAPGATDETCGKSWRNLRLLPLNE